MTAAAQRAIAATVEVRVRSADGDSSGAGFIVDPDGIAVTACHVVTVSGLIVRRVRVRLASRRRTMGTVVRAHPKLDFAVLWLELPGPSSRFLPVAGALEIGRLRLLRHRKGRGYRNRHVQPSQSRSRRLRTLTLSRRRQSRRLPWRPRSRLLRGPGGCLP